MYLLAFLDSPEACAPILGLIHGAVLTSTVDVRPLRACKIAVSGNFMCHTECKWALQILLGPSIYVSDSGKAQAQWPQAAGSRYYCTMSSLFNNKNTTTTFTCCLYYYNWNSTIFSLFNWKRILLNKKAILVFKLAFFALQHIHEVFQSPRKDEKNRYFWLCP